MQIKNTKSPLRAFRVIPGGLAQNDLLGEHKIEGRLSTLSLAVEHFVRSLPAAFLSEESSKHEVLDELVVKQSALQWIVRVAKHSKPGVRHGLWVDIEQQSLAGLEEMLELLSSLQQIERYSRLRHENQRTIGSSH